jgi:hypothetical protein
MIPFLDHAVKTANVFVHDVKTPQGRFSRFFLHHDWVGIEGLGFAVYGLVLDQAILQRALLILHG